jgi:hypothetical protein
MARLCSEIERSSEGSCFTKYLSPETPVLSHANYYHRYLPVNTSCTSTTMVLPLRLSVAIRNILQTTRSTKPFVPYHIRSRQSLTQVHTLRFASTLTSEPSSSSTHAVRIRAPSVEDMEAVELDPAIATEQEDASFEITSRAAEVRISVIKRLICWKLIQSTRHSLNDMLPNASLCNPSRNLHWGNVFHLISNFGVYQCVKRIRI